MKPARCRPLLVIPGDKMFSHLAFAEDAIPELAEKYHGRVVVIAIGGRRDETTRSRTVFRLKRQDVSPCRIDWHGSGRE